MATEQGVTGQGVTGQGGQDVRGPRRFAGRSPIGWRPWDRGRLARPLPCAESVRAGRSWLTRARWRPRLRTLLLLSNLVVLALPLGGILLLRLYESALVRQTESELVAQAAVLAGAWRAARGIEGPGLSDPVLDRVRRAGLDLARDPVLPPPPGPAPGPPARPEALDAGRRLSPVLRDAQAVTLAAMRILDGGGTVVATTGSDLGRSEAALEEVQRALRGEPVSVLRAREKPADKVPGGISRTSWLRVFTALPVMDGDRVDAVVLLSRTPRTLVQAISGKRPEIMAVGAILLVLVAALAAAASRLISQPLAAVVAQARRVAAGGTTVASGQADGMRMSMGTREVAELSDAIARMAETLERRAAYVRSLAAHVSHEFKTPLAGIRGAAELLEDHADTMTPEERAAFVARIQSGTARLDRLVRGLLDLARADMTRAADAPTPVRPVLERVAARHPAVSVRIAGDADAAVPYDALEGLFAALLGNVRDHAGPGASVEVALSEEDGTAVVRFADDGTGISPANRPRVFDPFFTTAREGGGTGLGLAIAHALVTGVGGTMGLEGPGRGTAFRIVLPAWFGTATHPATEPNGRSA